MPDKPDPDLINRVQAARMQHDAAVRPSQVKAVYWIEASRPPGDDRAPTARAGYWRIETTVQAVDDLWMQIRTATESGLLGYKAKVSTAPASGQTSPDARVIHVLTYDSADSADVERVRAALRDLGISSDIGYHPG
jgi:hypothetical protein